MFRSKRKAELDALDRQMKDQFARLGDIDAALDQVLARVSFRLSDPVVSHFDDTVLDLTEGGQERFLARRTAESVEGLSLLLVKLLQVQYEQERAREMERLLADKRSRVIVLLTLMTVGVGAIAAAGALRLL